VRLQSALSQYPGDRVINMDETSWKLLNPGFITVANRGSETGECLFSGDPKMCLTAIPAVDAAGSKLRPWILARGKTTRCEQRYRTSSALETAIHPVELVVSHEENGWTDTNVACGYLRWLKAGYPSRPVVLVWDVFTAHRCEQTRERAQELGIRSSLFHPERPASASRWTGGSLGVSSLGQRHGSMPFGPGINLIQSRPNDGGFNCNAAGCLEIDRPV
jgi:hypothetical protein